MDGCGTVATTFPRNQQYQIAALDTARRLLCEIVCVAYVGFLPVYDRKAFKIELKSVNSKYAEKPAIILDFASGEAWDSCELVSCL